MLSDKTHFPFFHRMMPPENTQYIGMVRLLKFFRWIWLGVLVSDDESAGTFLQIFLPLLSQNDICIEYLEVVPRMAVPSSHMDPFFEKLEQIKATLTSTTASVTLVYGDSQSVMVFEKLLEFSEVLEEHPVGNVWIRTAQWDFAAITLFNRAPTKSLNGTLSFMVHTNEVPGFQDFLQTINPYHSTIDLLKPFWQFAFKCSFPNHDQYIEDSVNCTGEEKLESLSGFLFEMGMTGQSYSIYNAVYAVAHALQAMCSSPSRQKAMGGGDTWNLQSWRVRSSLSHSRNGTN